MTNFLTSFKKESCYLYVGEGGAHRDAALDGDGDGGVDGAHEGNVDEAQQVGHQEGEHEALQVACHP